MLSNEIRRSFLKFFKEKNHLILPSSSVVAYGDPTLFFTNAGMNQFKDEFLGLGKDYKRVTTAQKCIRVGGKHNDLDNVGHTSRHLTFFEMLGNFSFGDYFKKEAIAFAWEAVLQVFQFDPERIWITVFKEDEESLQLWRSWVPDSRIVRMGEKDNFWSMGDTGPCGPCSELYYDRGAQYGSYDSIENDVDGNRYLEFWNLVFMQFDRDSSGRLLPLPRPSIDTGLGLERVVSLKMGVDNVFETDLLGDLKCQIEAVTGCTYGRDNQAAFHVIADHVRSLSFAIADGCRPSNVGGGYVLRKLLRRAVQYGKGLGQHNPFLFKLVSRLVDLMGEDYPELSFAQKDIEEVLKIEEEHFLKTLRRGGSLLAAVIEKAKARSTSQITGEEAFKLKDTYGFPIEEIMLIAKDSGLSVDLQRYHLLEEGAREKSKRAQEATQPLGMEWEHPSEFVGYFSLEAEAIIEGISVNREWVNRLDSGEEGIVFLNRTPFYAEKGGQVGDKGSIVNADGEFAVLDCRSTRPGVVAHEGKVLQGNLKVGDQVKVAVEGELRRKTENNHTATHLLHWALTEVLGNQIRQAGSLVAPNKLRFDFNCNRSLSKQELERIEDLVNGKIRENRKVVTHICRYEEIKNDSGIKQFFGDKYGEEVRVVDIGISKELCGGTHSKRTGDIGYFRILKEGSVAAGIRRIEAATGWEAEAITKSREMEQEGRVDRLEKELDFLHRQVKALNQKVAAEVADKYLSQLEQIGQFPFLGITVSVSSEELDFLVEAIMSKLSSGIVAVVFTTQKEDTREKMCGLIVRVTADLVRRGINAAQILKPAAEVIGASGGGRAESARAGGGSCQQVPEMFEKIRTLICAAG